MKYNIYINQYAAATHFPSLDILDLAIFDFIKDFAGSDKVKKMTDGGRVWFWVKWDLIVENMPILGIKTRQGVGQRVRNLCEAGLLFAHPSNQQMQQSFYAMGEGYMRYIAVEKQAAPLKQNLQPANETLQGCKQNFTGRVNETLHHYNNNDNNYNYNNRVSGDFQSPLPPNEKEEFSLFLKAQGLHRLASTNFFLGKEKVAAKRKEFGEEAFNKALQKIDEHLIDEPNFLSSKTDFSLVFTNFAKGRHIADCKSAFSSFFATKYGEDYTEYKKSDLDALWSILTHLRKTAGDEISTLDLMTKFFFAMGALPKFENPLNCKLVFIAKDLQQIIVLLKRPQMAQARTFKTAKEIDAENARIAAQQLAEKREKDYKAKFLQEDLERISKYVRNGMSVPDHLQNSEAYGIYISQQSQNFANDGW